MDTPMLRVISLGAGVQSSDLYLSAVAGEWPNEMPDAAIFADTQWEPAAVYSHLDRLEAIGGSIIPIVRTTAGDIRQAALDIRTNATSGRVSRVVTLPLYVRNADGSVGMLNRQCTRDFKIRPIRRAVHRLLADRGMTWRSGFVEQWIGISTDEATRMKDSGVGFIRNRFPLIEFGRSRKDCENRNAFREVVAPKSACIACPFTDPGRWRSIQAMPEEWANAVDFDRSIRSLAEVNGECFVNRAMKPLDEIDFTEKPAAPDDNLNLFENECEGMCGV